MNIRPALTKNIATALELVVSAINKHDNQLAVVARNNANLRLIGCLLALRKTTSPNSTQLSIVGIYTTS